MSAPAQIWMEEMADACSPARLTLLRWATQQPGSSASLGDLADLLEASVSTLPGLSLLLFPPEGTHGTLESLREIQIEEAVPESLEQLHHFVSQLRATTSQTASDVRGQLSQEIERLSSLLERGPRDGFPDPSQTILHQSTWTNGYRCACCGSEYSSAPETAEHEEEARDAMNAFLQSTELGGIGDERRWVAVSLVNGSVLGEVNLSWPPEKRKSHDTTYVHVEWKGEILRQVTVQGNRRPPFRMSNLRSAPVTSQPTSEAE